MPQPKEELPKIKDKHRAFVRAYIRDWNATQSYMKAYPSVTHRTAMVNGCKLLSNTKVKAHIEYYKANIEEACGISKQKIVDEVLKMVFTSIAHLHETWIDRTEFEKLTKDQQACIETIETTIVKRNIGTAREPDIVDVERIKVGLYSKLKAIEILNKMMGYNDPEKMDLSTLGKELGQVSVFQLPQNGRDANSGG